MSTDAPLALIGRTIGGKYLIESFLGGGAMGSVWKARQVALDKTVAVKVMHRQLAGDDTFAARFLREARAASRLDHPNSIRVYDHGEESDGILYIAMEYCEGRDLQQVMVEDWPLSDARIVDILSQALLALAIAHEMGVVHRDLKPDNLLVQRRVNDEGQAIDVVKVCDFGIATIAEPRSDPTSKEARRPNLTGAGFIVGTPEFMSPEQARGDQVDSRSDLYSMGIVLFRMLTGALPFHADSALGVAMKNIYEEPTHPVEVNRDANPRLAAVCLKALQKSPNDRHQSAHELRSDLRAQIDSIPLSINPASQLPTFPSSLADIKSEQVTLPSAPASDKAPTRSGLPSTTPLSTPAPLPSRRRSARFIPLLALGALFAGLVVFKLAGSRTAPPHSAPATPTLVAPAVPKPPVTPPPVIAPPAVPKPPPPAAVLSPTPPTPPPEAPPPPAAPR